jgi:hypothetical protein
MVWTLRKEKNLSPSKVQTTDRPFCRLVTTMTMLKYLVAPLKQTRTQREQFPKYGKSLAHWSCAVVETVE